MHYAVYADLSRPLTSDERSSVSEALDSMVPGSGCVGRQRQTNDEVFFAIEAVTENEAAAQAACYMTAMIQTAGLEIDYTIELQPMNARGPAT